MKIRILFLFLCVAALMGCQPSGSENDTLPSGYEYILHTPDNTGKAAEPGAMAFFRAAIRNGDVIVNSNYDATFPQAAAVPANTTDRPLAPWEEALMMMKEGDSLTIIVPLDTVPAEQKPQGFADADELFYDITLKEVKLQADIDAAKADIQNTVEAVIDQYKAGSLENLQKTDSGLEYVILEEGDGVQPDSAFYVYVDYYGALLENKSNFDDSYKRATPFAFQLGMGRVIPGWDEGIALLSSGAKAVFFIPSELGYGEGGSPPVIPANADLVFLVNLLSFLDPAVQ